MKAMDRFACASRRLDGFRFPNKAALPAAIAAVLIALPMPSPLALSSAAAEQPAGSQSVTLRYRFTPGEVVRWQVQHLNKVRTTVAGTSQTVETNTRSVKIWRVVEVKPTGEAVFENSVEQVNLTHEISGRAPVRYDSQTDSEAPAGFEQFAQSVGQPLFRITIDPRGEVVTRETLFPQAADEGGQLTIPLPEEPISPGYAWTVPHELSVPLKTGELKRVQTRQRYSLESVTDAVARIAVETQILTPVHNPEVQVQVVQKCFQGHVEFDIEQGRIRNQQMDLDEQVVGFAGESSSMHCVTRFTEDLLPTAAETARVAGPAQPPR